MSRFEPAILKDSYGREVHYLRISVTDRCNLRCAYCRGQDMPFIEHDDILRFEEIERVIAIAADMGVHKLRFTGGEPLARKGFIPFLRRIRERFPHIRLTMTTNGTLLGPMMDEICELGVAVNISVDSLDRQHFAEITGVDALPEVQKNLDRLLELGVPLKLNAVAMRGRNSADLPDLAALAMTNPIDVRFIEFMPMGEGSIWSDELFWSAENILADLREHWELVPEPVSGEDIGPARLWRLRDANGRISQGRMGIISSVSQHCCGSCNRLRLTSEGRLRTCLYDDREYPLREALRSNTPDADEAVRRIMQEAVLRKPIGAEILARRHGPVTQKGMSAIGG